MVQSNTLRVAAEEEDRSVFALGGWIRLENRGMIQAFENLELPAGGFLGDFAVFPGELPGQHVDAGAAARGWVADMVRQPILVKAGRAVEDQLVQNEIPDFPGLL